MSVAADTIAYESIATTSIGTVTDSVTVSKPSGLAVGDTMIAGVAGTSLSFASWASPAGWTEQVDSADNSHGLAVYTKTADSSDVSATDFTFTLTDSDTESEAGGFLIRASSVGAVKAVTTDTISGTATLNPTTITPDYADSLFILIGSDGNLTGTPVTFSGYATTTDNPTWTERFDDGSAGTTYQTSLAVATAIRTAITATGDFTITLSANGGRSYGVALCLSPSISGTVTATTGDVFFVNHPVLRSGAVDVDGDDPDTSSREITEWTNETKPSTTWTNEST